MTEKKRTGPKQDEIFIRRYETAQVWLNKPERTEEERRDFLDRATSTVVQLVEGLYGLPYNVVLQGPYAQQLRFALAPLPPRPEVA
jgi:hypothetical protein